METPDTERIVAVHQALIAEDLHHGEVDSVVMARIVDELGRRLFGRGLSFLAP